MKRRSLLLFGLLLAFTLGQKAQPVNGQDSAPADPPHHVTVALTLVEKLKDASENLYGGGKRHIEWEGDPCAARTVCSSFMTLLLQHTYGWTSDDIRSWFGSTNPEAFAYHDAIVKRKQFKRIVHVTAIRPGDILAMKYTDHHVSSNGIEDTGHVMLVVGAPEEVRPSKPIVAGTRQYTVSVIDSSASGHGPDDTRHRPNGSFSGGIGKGVFRIYATDDGKIAGYTWSNTTRSPFYSSTERELAAGRIVKEATESPK